MFDTNNLFDSHCHLNTNVFENISDEVIKRAIEAGITQIIDVATDIDSSKKTLENSNSYPDIVHPTIGIHPEVFVPGSEMYIADEKEGYIEKQISIMDKMLSVQGSSESKYVMIGECGIDLYWLNKNKVSDEVLITSTKLQSELFLRQVELASKHKLPLTIHTRDSLDLVLKILDPYVGKVEAILHSFTGSYEEACKIFDMGFKIGINGIVTYKSATDLQEAIKKIIGTKKIDCPNDLYDLGIYLETDSPYLTPRKSKYRPNEPASIKTTYEYLASL